MALDVSGFNVPSTPLTDEGATARLAQNMWRNREWQYRMQKEKEADEWRKLNMIQDLTDLSKHQTSSDVANAIGNQHAANILQKYTASAATMSPTELMGNVSKDMSGVLNGMEGTKNELDMADKQMAVIKQQFPDLDMSSLAKDYRGDILNRRLKNENEFVNPIEVQPSQMDVGNPEFLSKYATGDKNLRSYFQNPQGMDEMSVYKGTPNNYTKYTAKVPSYKKTNFDPTQLKGGFMTGQGEPSLQFKSSTLPSDALPSSNGKPFEMMDKDVYDNITGKEKIELIASTRKQVPNYDQMNPTEKEYAQRHVLLNTAKAFDQTNFHPTEVHTPSAAMLKLQMGESGKGAGGELTINDVYGGIDKDLADWEKQGSSQMMPFQNISQDAKDVLIPKLQQNQKALDDGGAVNTEDLKLVRGNDGGIRVFKSDGDYVMDIGKKNTNLKAQPSVKEKREVIKQSEQGGGSYLIKGKTYSHKQLMDMGYTSEQVAQYKQ